MESVLIQVSWETAAALRARRLADEPWDALISNLLASAEAEAQMPTATTPLPARLPAEPLDGLTDQPTAVPPRETSEFQGCTDSFHSTYAWDGGNKEFRLFGQTYWLRHDIDIYFAALRVIWERYPELFDRLALVARGRKRNPVGRSPEAIHPGRPDLRSEAREVVPGWFLDTNIATRDKRKLLELACELAGVGFGTDVVVPFSSY